MDLDFSRDPHMVQHVSLLTKRRFADEHFLSRVRFVELVWIVRRHLRASERLFKIHHIHLLKPGFEPVCGPALARK